MANYKTSWVQRLIDGAWQKTFAFAHAKTVYTDFANKKTLADKLSEIDTEIGNKANKTEIPTELPANGGNSATVNGHTVKSDVPENAVFTDTVYDDTEVQKRISDNGYGETAGGKNLANFSKLGSITTNGITFEYQSNGSIKVSGTASTDGSVYTPLKLTKTRLSKGRWYTSSVKSSNHKSIAKLFFTDNGDTTTLQMSETADLYYYIQFFDGVEGKIPAGTVIDEVLYPQIEEGKVVTSYEPYFPSNKMLAEENTQQSTEMISIKNTANFSHNIPRNVPKDITSYITDGTFYNRLNGTDGFELFEDIYVGDYIKMSRAITCPDSTGGMVGSQYVTIAGLDTMMNNGGDGKYVNYHHAVMVPGQGFDGIQHFGRHAMNATNTTDGGYAASVMNQSVFGAVATEGYTASGATINQQLYAEFGSHLKTTDELLSTGINATGTNRFGTANGCSNDWGWSMRQAVLMSEVEVYGSTVLSSSGYDTGNAKMQLPLFAHSRNAMNDRSSWYWIKDVASSASFCLCSSRGDAGYYGAGGTGGYVRPRFIIS